MVSQHGRVGGVVNLRVGGCSGSKTGEGDRVDSPDASLPVRLWTGTYRPEAEDGDEGVDAEGEGDALRATEIAMGVEGDIIQRLGWGS